MAQEAACSVLTGALGATRVESTLVHILLTKRALVTCNNKHAVIVSVKYVNVQMSHNIDCEEDGETPEVFFQNL